MHSFLSRKEEGVLGKSDVVAYTKAKLSILSIECWKLGWAWTDIIALEKSDASWDIHIEEVLFAMHGLNLALFVKTEACIENSPIIFN